MLGRFFKPRWQHANPEVRCQAVALLHPVDEATLLAQLARGDADDNVRCAATSRLIDLAMLDQVNKRDRAEVVREAASQRIMALLAGTTPDAPPPDTRLRLVRLTRNTRVLAFIAEQSPDKVCRQAAIQGLADDQLLYQFALEGIDESTRLLACERIQNLALLKKLSREGRDKRVSQSARQRAKVIQEQQQQQQARHSQQLHLVELLEQHQRRPFDALYPAKFEQLVKQWHGVCEDAEEALLARANEAIAIAQERVEQHQQHQQQEADRHHAEDERHAALQTLQQLFARADADTWAQQRAEIAAAMATQVRRWETAEQLLPATAEQQQAFTHTLTGFQQLLALAEQAHTLAEQPDSESALRELAQQWPQEYPRPAPLCIEPTKALKGANKPDKSVKQPHSAYRGLLVALQRELRQGNLRHANRLWHRAEVLIEEHNDRSLAAALEKLQPRRQELQDWHAFAAEPKKQQLCEEIEALIGSSMDPQQLASAIQALHDQWRSLMSSDQDADQALWDRFKAASDQAYEPCQAHFAELDELKKSNLQQRQTLLEQLQAFVAQVNWEKADWQAIWQIRRQAPKDWKALQPVHFTDARDQQKQFSALLALLDERLQEAEQAALAAREPLLLKAKQLADMDDKDAACREAIPLQKQWAQAPWLPPARYRPLQKQFRTLMDRLFNARNAAKDAQRQQLQLQLADMNSELDLLAQQLAQPVTALDREAVNAQLGQLQSQAQDAALPSPVKQRLQRLEQQARQCLAAQGQWQQWQQLLQHLAQLPVSSEPSETALDLAVAIEALAGTPSPEDQQQRRMAWQLERLPKAMKKQDFDNRKEIRALIGRYDEPITEPLRQRIEQALNGLVDAPPGS